MGMGIQSRRFSLEPRGGKASQVDRYPLVGRRLVSKRPSGYGLLNLAQPVWVAEMCACTSISMTSVLAPHLTPFGPASFFLTDRSSWLGSRFTTVLAFRRREGASAMIVYEDHNWDSCEKKLCSSRWGRGEKAESRCRITKKRWNWDFRLRLQMIKGTILRLELRTTRHCNHSQSRLLFYFEGSPFSSY